MQKFELLLLCITNWAVAMNVQPLALQPTPSLVFSANDLQRFPTLNNQIPVSHKDAFAKFIQTYDKPTFIQKNPSGNYEAELQRINADATVARAFAWQGLAHSCGLHSVFLEGYLHIGNGEKQLLNGKREDLTIDNLNRLIRTKERDGMQRNTIEKAPDIIELKQKLAGNYKIHLMPTIQDMTSVLLRILEELQRNQELQNALSEIKCKETLSADDVDKPAEQIHPRIVLFPATGKVYAQKVLDSLFRLLHDVEGIHVVPRYSQKINSLISVTQGDSDWKDDRFKEFYDAQRIFYKADFSPDGANNGYQLQKPSV